MLKTFVRLLGENASIFRRYVAMAIAYGLLCGLTITALIPLLGHLLAGQAQAAGPWLIVLLAGVLISWWWRKRVEQAGIQVGVAVLQGGRHCLGDHVASLPVGWFTPHNTAGFGHVVMQGLMGVAQLPAHVFTPVISGVVTPLVLVVALLVLHWPLGLIALLALPVLVLVFVLTSRLASQADVVFQRQFAQSSQRIVEFAQAQSVLRAFSGEGGSARFLEQAVDQQQQSGLRLIGLSALSTVLNTWAVQCLFAVLLAVAALWLNGLSGGLVAGSEIIAAIVALVILGRFIDPLLEVAGYGEVLRSARGQLEVIGRLFAAQPLVQAEGGQVPRDASVQLRDVVFSYAPDAAPVLQGLSLDVAAGSMVALVGASGSGKTTVTRLIARFFDVDQGSVCIGGVNVREMPAAQLAGQISQIFQDSYLFAGSIADNIRIGKPDATDAEVLEAAQQAGVGEIIERLAQGLDTPVGEGGARLSGGERQRIAIARALIKKAPILLVDEATAALDAENQAAIAQALARLRGRCTLLVIAHQLSTIAQADHVVVLEQGRVVEQGPPAQLRNGQGRYAQFLAQRWAAKGWRIEPENPLTGSVGERR